MSVLNKLEIARIDRFFMMTTDEDFLKYILENIVVDNFLMRFWTLAQYFGSKIFIPKDVPFHALQHIKNPL